MPESDMDDFGEPIEIRPGALINIETTPEPDFCPYKKRRCMCWDHGCQVDPVRDCIGKDEQ